MKPENTVWYMQYIIVSLPMHICTIIGPMYFVFCILGLFDITYVQKQILVVQSMNIWQSTKDGLNCDYQMNWLSLSLLCQPDCPSTWTDHSGPDQHWRGKSEQWVQCSGPYSLVTPSSMPHVLVDHLTESE